MCTGNTEGEERERKKHKKYLNNDRHQTTDPGSLENTPSRKLREHLKVYTKAHQVGTAQKKQKSCKKPVRAGMEEQGYDVHRTSLQKTCK